MNTANKIRSYYEILGLNENEISIKKIESSYRDLRNLLESDPKNVNEFRIRELEKAFEYVIERAERLNANSGEDDAISAIHLPILTKKVASKGLKSVREPSGKEPSTYQPDSQAGHNSEKGRARAEKADDSETLRLIEELVNSEKISGSLLKKLREKMNVGIDELSVRVKINKNYLNAIEEDRFEDLPAEVYARGFFVSYLHYIGLDRKDLVEALIQIYRGTKKR